MLTFAKMNRRHERKNTRSQCHLNSVASSISSDIFNQKESLPVDRSGRVDIHPSHSDFKLPRRNMLRKKKV